MLACSECLKEYANSNCRRCGQCKSIVCIKCYEGKVHTCQAMRIVRISDLVQERVKVEWLVENLLPSVGWTLFHGTHGYGKSTFALQMCDALQQGLPFLGRDTKQTNIMFVQADSDIDEWHAICTRVAPSCKSWTVLDAPERALGNPRYVETMVMYTKRLKPGLIIFDSLYNLCASPTRINTGEILLDINQMKAIANGVPWILIHHPTKDSNRASGHNSLEANCSNEWSMLKDKLVIQKGRLVADKEIKLIRSDLDGKWSLYDDPLKRPSDTGGGSLMRHVIV